MVKSRPEAPRYGGRKPRPRKKARLVYKIDHGREHGYGHLRLAVRYMYEHATANDLWGAEENRAGYGTPEAAARQERWFQWLLEQGYDIRLADHLDTRAHGRGAYRDAPEVYLRLDWQEYEPEKREYGPPGYIEAYVRGEHHPHQLKEIYDLMAKIGKHYLRREVEAYALERYPRDPNRDPQDVAYYDELRAEYFKEEMRYRQGRGMSGWWGSRYGSGGLWSNPTAVIETIEAMGGKEAKVVKDPVNDYNNTWVYAIENRRVLRTDQEARLASLLGMHPDELNR